MYSSHNSNIKCLGSTIKCIGFEPNHCAINLNIVSFFMVFSNFDSMFLSMYYYFESMKLFFSSNNNNNKVNRKYKTLVLRIKHSFIKKRIMYSRHKQNFVSSYFEIYKNVY